MNCEVGCRTTKQNRELSVKTIDTKCISSEPKSLESHTQIFSGVRGIMRQLVIVGSISCLLSAAHAEILNLAVNKTDIREMQAQGSYSIDLLRISNRTQPNALPETLKGTVNFRAIELQVKSLGLPGTIFLFVNDEPVDSYALRGENGDINTIQLKVPAVAKLTELSLRIRGWFSLIDGKIPVKLNITSTGATSKPVNTPAVPAPNVVAPPAVPAPPVVVVPQEPVAPPIQTTPEVPVKTAPEVPVKQPAPDATAPVTPAPQTPAPITPAPQSPAQPPPVKQEKQKTDSQKPQPPKAPTPTAPVVTTPPAVVAPPVTPAPAPTLPPAPVTPAKECLKKICVGDRVLNDLGLQGTVVGIGTDPGGFRPGKCILVKWSFNPNKIACRYPYEIEKF